MKEFFNFLLASKIIQLSVAVTLFCVLMTLALSFGGSLYIQAKRGCFDSIIHNIVDEVKK
jgi:hypothetical protein